MQNKRPTAVLVMAILNFVFGAIAIFSVMCGGVAMLAMGSLAKSIPAPKGGPNPLVEMTGMFESIPGYIPYMIVGSILRLIAAIALIVAGVGLLKMRPWARWTSAGYGIFSIAIAVFDLVYTVTLVNPAMQRWQEQFIRRQGGVMPPGGNIGGTIGAVIGGIFAFAYPIALLIVMFLPHVSAAFAGRSLPQTAADMPEDYRGGELPRAGGPYGGESYRPGDQGKWS